MVIFSLELNISENHASCLKFSKKKLVKFRSNFDNFGAVKKIIIPKLKTLVISLMDMHGFYCLFFPRIT